MIQPVGFIDTWALSASLYAKHRDRFVPLLDDEGVTMFAADAEMREEWKSLRAFLTKIRGGASRALGGLVEVDRVAFFRLIGPRAALPWAHEDREGARLYVTLVPSPGGWLYSGGAGVCAATGTVHAIDARQLTSCCNFHDTPWILAVVDLKRPDVVDDAEG